MLRIQRSANSAVVFSLSGRIEVEDIAELKRLFDLEASSHRVALDLQDITLVDRDAVQFLARFKGDGIELKNCPGYIREWLDRERPQEH